MAAATYTYPLVDEQNPFYCPAVPASSYILSVQHHLRYDAPRQKHSHSFAQYLERAIEEETRYSDFAPSEPAFHGSMLPGSNRNPFSDFSPRGARSSFAHVLKRKRSGSSNTFSDIRGPERYTKSLQSVHDSSFDLSIQAEQLHYSSSAYSHRGPVEPPVEFLEPTVESLSLKIRALEDQLYGPPIGTESPRGIKSLILRLEGILPGIRLADRLNALKQPSHQTIADFLAENGLLNARVLYIIRTSEIQRLRLGPSLADAHGLNLAGSDLLSVFSAPHSFLFLSELVLSGANLDDVDMVHIHHLPRLTSLLLDNTNVGNEAIFLLISLKRTLTRLSIRSNPCIDDSVIPALILLSKLVYISALDTSIEMPGLRRFASSIVQNERTVKIEIPLSCKEYITNMHAQYLINPTPPLIVNPAVCTQLSLGALRRNLAAHAACNPSIVTSGTKPEMVARLTSILQTRKLDLICKETIFGDAHGEPIV